MSAHRGLEKLNNWRTQSTPLGLITAVSRGHEVIAELQPAFDESSEWGKLLLSFGGEIEVMDLSGATFAATPDTFIGPVFLQITLPDGRFIVLSDRRRQG